MILPPARLRLRAACAAALALASGLAVRAQYTPPPPPKASVGVINETLRGVSPAFGVWDVGLNERLRFEDKLGAGTTDAGSNWDFSRRPGDDNNNQYLLSRLMPRVAYAGRPVSFTLEGRSSYSWGDERYSATAPGSGLTDRDAGLDVHQAFVLIGNPKQSPLSLKLGRQELVYGDQRLVGHFRWGNNARTFDAAKLRWETKTLTVDVFTGGVVYTDSGNFNRSNSQDHFSGVYATFPALSAKDSLDAYVFARNVERGIATDNWSGVAAPFRFPGAQDIYTLGLRGKSKPKGYGPWDYGYEVMYQFGNRTAVFPATTPAAALAAPRLQHHAYAGVLQAGYTFGASPVQPRLTLTYSMASGDRDPSDRTSNTFQNLFPTNHLFYGYMDLNSLQNIHDVRLACSCKPTPTTSLALEGHTHYLNRSSDYWYNVAGAPRNFTGAPIDSGAGYRINPAYGRHLGDELDFVIGWSVTPYAQLEAAACHYFRGAYIKQSLASVGSKDASYAYLQVTLNL